MADIKVAKPSKRAIAAATEIWQELYRSVGQTQDEAAKHFIEESAKIISKHCDGEPAWLSEALNSGDGTYKP